ncbi:MAG: hypothetical protein H7288_07290 [Kineosporiaceae bacterium]|nr:hypothetical protein [Aeromicrobium sp.]
MPSGSETIIVIEDRAVSQEDWEGDPIVGATAPIERSVTGCVLIPRMSPDDPTLVIDGYTVLLLDTSQTPPSAEDSIKIRGTSQVWAIDGNVGDFTKPSGEVKLLQFNIARPR